MFPRGEPFVSIPGQKCRRPSRLEQDCRCPSDVDNCRPVLGTLKDTHLLRLRRILQRCGTANRSV